MAGVCGQFDDCDDTPREVDLLTEEHVEDLLDAVECLRGKVEQLQIQCEKLIYEKGQVEDRLISQERESLEKEYNYEKELSDLRKLNLEWIGKVKSNEDMKEMPSWAKTSLDAEMAVTEKVEAEKEVKCLQILLKENDTQISNLEWQIMDAEATVTSIQAERDRLAVELDCMLAREEENLEYYRDSSDERVILSDDEYDSPKTTPSHQKQTRRHLSDLTCRDNSEIDDFTEFVHKGKHVSTLSNIDVPSSAAEQFLGGLKRTNNFSNINDVDEFTDFHQDEGMGGDACSIDLSASLPSSKIKSLTSSCWCSFGSDSDVDTSPASKAKNSKAPTPWVLSDVPCDDTKDDQVTNVEGCFDDAVDWTLDVEPAPLGSLVGSKNESCRSSSSAYFSDNSTTETVLIHHDPWMFTPDSIIDVSTGEELKVTPSGSKSSLAEEDEVESDNPGTTSTQQDISAPVPHENNVKTHKLSPENNSNSTTTQKQDINLLPKNKTSNTLQADFMHQHKNGLDRNTGNNIKAALDASFERTASVRSDSAVDTVSKEAVHHQRINSEPSSSPTRQTSEDKEGFVKLQAYQKWRMSGGKGQPPAKLKISQC